MTPSPQQSAIFAFVRKGESNLIIDAKAGSGKTTTLVELLKCLPVRNPGELSPARIRFFAFNKLIADTLSARVPKNVVCSTFHSAGLSALKGSGQIDPSISRSRDWVDSGKCRKLVFNACGRDNPDLNHIIRLVSLTKTVAILPDAIDFDMLQSFADVHSMSLEDPRAAFSIVKSVATKSFSDLSSIDFDDMLYLPVMLGCAFDWQDWVMCDEAQDTNDIQIEILDRMQRNRAKSRAEMLSDMKAGNYSPCASDGTEDRQTRFVFVGDPHQCHPTGTLIDTPIGQQPIETLAAGDSIIGYHRDKLNFRTRKVLAVAKRQFCGELLAIMTETTHHKVTHNHRCFVRMQPNTKKYALYVMQKGTQVRLGISILQHDDGRNGFGPGLRGRQERADKVWVLSVHDDQRDALIHEKAVGARYGISDMCFMNSGEVATSQDVLDAAWSIVGDGTDRLKAILKNYGRDIEYPLWSKGDATHIGVKSFITAACNILPEVMEVGVRDEQELVWSSFTLHKFPYYGDVWSLSVEADPTTGRRLYVAEGIVTHNSIYGFRGANSDAMNKIGRRFDCSSLPLSVSYRCSINVIKEAQKTVKDIEWREGAPDGLVEPLTNYTEAAFMPGSAVLCRNTAPLISHAYAMLSRDIPCIILGRDIGANLIAIVKKMRATNIEDLRQKLNVWRVREAKRAESENRSPESIYDQHTCLCYFIDSLDEDSQEVADVIAKIELMFTDDITKKTGRVTLSTIHKAKGLEYPTVFILDRNLIPSRYAITDAQIRQEKNLLYVAQTRAILNLYYITSDNWKSETTTTK